MFQVPVDTTDVDHAIDFCNTNRSLFLKSVVLNSQEKNEEEKKM